MDREQIKAILAAELEVARLPPRSWYGTDNLLVARAARRAQIQTLARLAALLGFTWSEIWEESEK